MIEAYIQNRISTPIDDKVLKESLDDTMIEAINKLNDPALFFVSNNLHVNPIKVSNPIELTNKLIPIIGIPRETLESAFVIKKKAYIVILSKMSIMTRDIVKKRIDTEK